MKPSRFLRLPLLAACALCLPLTACKKSAPAVSAETLAVLQEMESTVWTHRSLEKGDVARVIARYRETGDPNTEDKESGLTILELACAARHLVFAEELLKQGASAEKSEPLTTLLTTTPAEEDEETTIAFIDLLAAHGADVSKLTESEYSLIAYAAAYSTEAVCLHLMDMGANLCATDAASYATVFLIASRSWNDVLRRVIAQQAPLSDESGTALHAAAMKGDEDGHAETMQILLEAGVDVNAVDAEGQTPLYQLVSALNAEETEDERACIRLLLEHGATLTEPPVYDERFGEVTAYDFLASHTDLLSELREEGLDIPDQPLIIREEAAHLRSDLMRADLRMGGHPQAPELLKPYLPLLTKVLTQHLYGGDGEMAGAAFSLLCAADKSLAEQVLPHLPLWTDYKEWELKENAMPAGTEILSVIFAQKAPLTIPKDKILQAAAMMTEHEDLSQAMDVAELLEYAPGAEEDIERLSADDNNPALQIGAMTAKLHLAGLPDAKAYSTEAWLGDYDAACLPPSVMKVLRLTDVENFWYGDLDAQDRAALISDMESLGLYTVANIYRKALPANLSDDELAAVMEEAAEQAIALELAVARFILENRKDFETARR